MPRFTPRRLAAIERAMGKRNAPMAVQRIEAKRSINRFAKRLADWPAAWVRADAHTGKRCHPSTVRRVRRHCRDVAAAIRAGKLATMIDVARAMPPEARAGLRWSASQARER